MKSSWEYTKQHSLYHFDKTVMDPRWDNTIGLGKFMGNWSQELAESIANAKPSTWETRGYKAEDTASPDIEAEEYDLIQAGADPKLIIARFEWQLAPVFQKMCDLFALEDAYNRLHVQYTGEVFNLHIDKLQKWCPEDPSKVMRVVIHLNDWEPGQFYSYGNHVHTHWRAGDIHTFDWINVPHSTANAGLLPRATLQTTGKITEQTQAFLAELKKTSAYQI
jgi:hypothetical protein